MPHGVLGSRRQPRTVISPVIDIRAAADRRYAQLREQRFDPAVQLALAVITTRPVVADIVGIVKFFGDDESMPYANLLC